MKNSSAATGLNDFNDGLTASYYYNVEPYCLENAT